VGEFKSSFFVYKTDGDLLILSTFGFQVFST